MGRLLFLISLCLFPLYATAKMAPKTLTSWEIRGAIAAKNKAKAWSASLNWLQSGPNAYQIRLMGPLGSGSVLIARQGNTVFLQDGPRKRSASNAEALLFQSTGIRLPVNNLYYWVRGLPAPGPVTAAVRDKKQHLLTLRQSGYDIEFTEYTLIKNLELPSKIRLQGKGLLVKVLIKRWQF